MQVHSPCTARPLQLDRECNADAAARAMHAGIGYESYTRSRRQEVVAGGSSTSHYARRARAREREPSGAAAHYAEALGWSLCPIPPGSKAPRARGWPDNGVTDSIIARRAWARKPDWGMGLIHDPSGTCTLDADADVVHVARALAAGGVDYRALLDTTGPQIVGNPENPPKLLYRVPEGLTLRRRALAWAHPEKPSGRMVVFELRGGPGVQDVLPPTVHPDTGEPYRWTGSGCPRSPEEIPFLPACLLHTWLHWPAREMRGVCPWAPTERHHPRPSTRRQTRKGPSVIEAFNERYAVDEILARNGYKRHGKRWLSPHSTTGVPGVVKLGGHAYAHHANDPLGDGERYDAFGVLATLEHNGDLRAAARAARTELGF